MVYVVLGWFFPILDRRPPIEIFLQISCAYIQRFLRMLRATELEFIFNAKPALHKLIIIIYVIT